MKTSRLFFIGMFAALLLVRIVVASLSHFDHHIGDSPKYLKIADSILNGHPSFVLNNGLYVSAPLYPFVITVCKLLFGGQYIFVLQLLQMVASALAGIFLYKLSLLLFNKRSTAILAVVFYGLLPSGIFFTYKVAQETFFTVFLIVSMYYLVCFLSKKTLSKLVLSAVFYSLALHTKSLIGIYSPFIVLAIVLSRQFALTGRIRYSIIYAAICFAFTIPYGVYNRVVHGTFTLASSGPGCVVYFGNTEMQYRFVVEPPPPNSEAYYRLLGMDFSFGNGASYDSLMKQPFNKRERFFYAEAYKWIRENPCKFVKLKIESARLFLTPSVSKKHYPFKTWLLSFVTLAPVYLFAYFGILMALKNDFRKHSWILWLFFILFVFMVVCGSVSRYRTAILEPFYTIYGAYAMVWVYERLRGGRKTIPELPNA